MVLRFLIIALLAAGIGLQSANADRIYTWTDDKGVVHITKEPPPPAKKADAVIRYKPQTEEQIRAVQKEAEKQQPYGEKPLRPALEKKSPPAAAVEQGQSGQSDAYYQYGGGRYSERARRYERREAVKKRLESGEPIKRPRRPRRSGRKR